MATTLLIDTRGKELTWPWLCACCSRPAETNLRIKSVAYENAGYKRTITRKTTTSVPYCNICKKHTQQWPGMPVFALSLLAIGWLIFGIWWEFIYPWSVGRLVLNAIIFVLPLAIVLFYERMARKKSMAGMQSGCVSPSSAVIAKAREAPTNVKGNSLRMLIWFKNEQYASKFQEMHRDSIVVRPVKIGKK